MRKFLAGVVVATVFVGSAGWASLAGARPARAAVVINEYNIPSATALALGPRFITSGADGALYITNTTNNVIQRLATSGNVTTTYAIPAGNFNPYPQGVIKAPDGSIWFAEMSSNDLGRLDPATGNFLTFGPLFLRGSIEAKPYQLTMGPDGLIWFTESGSGRIGNISPNNGFIGGPFDLTDPNSDPEYITTGPDGNLWFTESNANKYAFINPSSHSISEFALPNTNSRPHGITSFGGALWVAEGAGRVARIDPSSHAVTNEFSVGIGAVNIVAGADGNLYVDGDSQFASYIARLTPNGAVFLAQWPTYNSFIGGMTLGPDGNLWFVESAAGKAGQLIIGSLPPASGAIGISPLSVSPTEGQQFVGPVATVFAAGSGFSGTIDWGDAGATSTAQFTSIGSGLYSVAPVPCDSFSGCLPGQGGHTYVEEGSYTITVSVADGSGHSAAQGIAAVVADAPLVGAGGGTLTGVENTGGATCSSVCFFGPPPFNVAAFNDANSKVIDAGQFAASINWGDGGVSAGMVQVASGVIAGCGACTYLVTANHVFDEGTYPVSVTVTDDGGASITLSSTAVISDAALQLFGGPATGASGSEGSPVTVQIPYADPGAPGTDYTTTITWGDGGIVTAAPADIGVARYDPAGGFLYITHTYAEEGAYSISVHAVDEGGASADATTSASIADAPLSGSAAQNLTGQVGQALNSAIVATVNDPGGDGDLSAMVDWGDGTTPSAAALIAAGGGFAVVGSHTFARGGTLTTKIHLADPGGAALDLDGSAVVIGLAASGRSITANEGTQFSGVVATFTNADAPPGNVSATIYWGDGTSSAGTVAAQSGTTNSYAVSGSHTYAEGSGSGAFAIAIALKDDNGDSASATGSASVADYPLSTTPVATLGAIEGAPLSSPVLGKLSDADPGSALADFSSAPVTINWGDGATGAGVLTPTGSGSYAITASGSHVYAEEGSYTATYAVSDLGGGSASGTVTVTVADASLLVAALPISSTEGQSVSDVEVATFTDGGGAEPVGNYAASIAWGDGGTSAGTVTYSGGVFHVTGSHTFTEEGSLTLTVTVTDDGATATPGDQVSASAAATIADAVLSLTPITVYPVEGTLFNGDVATLTDMGGPEAGGHYSVRIAWGDGSSSLGTVTLTGGVLHVMGSHVYAEEGASTISVSVTDDGGSAAGTTATAAIADAPLTLTPLSIRPVEGTSFLGNVASIADAGGMESFASYNTTIDWGDGSPPTQGFITQTSTALFATGSHTYLEEGTYQLAVTVGDEGGATVIVTTAVTVADAALILSAVPVAATEGASFSGDVATFVDSGRAEPVANYRATIDWGDQSSSAGNVTIVNGVFHVAGTHVYGEEGSPRVTVTVSDDGGSTASAAAAASVGDAPLSSGGTLTVGMVPGVEGVAFTNQVVAYFRDADPAGSAADYTATIDWGDGQSSTGAVSEIPSQQIFQVTGGHTYAEEGKYPITVTISDAGATTIATSEAGVSDARLQATSRFLFRAVEGQAFQGSVLDFFDADQYATAADYTATVQWGDGTSSAASVGAYPLGGFYVTSPHVYAEEGQYSASVWVADAGGAVIGGAPVTIVVADAPLHVRVNNLLDDKGHTIVAGQSTGLIQVATFTDDDPAGTASDYIAIVDWGDGSKNGATVSANPTGGFTVISDHIYGGRNLSGYTVTVTVTEKRPGWSEASATGTAVVKGKK